MIINGTEVALKNGKIRRIEDDWTHSYWNPQLGFIPGVTTILEEGMPTPLGLKMWWQGSSLRDINERLSGAQDHGSLVHSILEKLNNGETIKTRGEDGKYQYSKTALLAVNSYRQFLTVWKPEEVISEQIVFYEDEKRAWAGTVDLIAKIDGKWYIIDFKTGSIIAHKEKLQVLAYKKAVEQALEIEIAGAFLLQLGTKHRNILSKPSARAPFILDRSPQGEGWRIHTTDGVTIQDFERVYDTWLMVNDGEVPEPPKVIEFPNEIKLFEKGKRINDNNES